MNSAFSNLNSQEAKIELAIFYLLTDTVDCNDERRIYKILPQIFHLSDEEMDCKPGRDEAMDCEHGRNYNNPNRTTFTI